MELPLLSIDAVTKRYGAHVVLAAVSLDLQAGETAALLGENGAGKSTLAKVLAGAVRPDGGTLRIDGEEVRFGTPREALTHGIGFIPQELIYAPNLSVAENIVLGRWPRRAGVTSSTWVRRLAAREAAEYGFDLPLGRPMSSISLAQQQRVEILKAVARRSRIVVLDEPTAALNSSDSEQLLTLMTGLAANGVGVIYISHRLDEVFRACWSVHVLRNGALVHSSAISDTTPSRIIAQMLGRDAVATAPPGPAVERHTEPVLRIGEWSRSAQPVLDDVSLEVSPGEIVGLYGVQGAGAETVAETLGGLHPDVRGRTKIDGREVASIRSPFRSRRLGVSYVPADRKSQGLILLLTTQRSLSLLVQRSLSRLGVVSARRERSMALRLAQQVRLRARGVRQPVGELSGGNQQKVLMGSRLAQGARLLVLHEPTRGVDVGARQELHRLVRKVADDGAAILLVSSDIEEAVLLSDRLHVMRGGRIVHEIARPTLESQPEALHAAGGLV